MKISSTPTNDTHEYIKKYLQDFENLSYGVVVAKNDLHSTLIYANPAFYKMIGHTKTQFEEKHGNRITEILVDRFHETVEKLLADKIYDFELDLRINSADGKIAWLHDHTHYDPDLDLFFVTTFDNTNKMVATARNLSYEAFQARNEILSYLSKYTSEHIIVVDAKTEEVVYMNVAAAQMFGFKHERDWAGKTYFEIGFGGDKNNVDPHYYDPLTENFTSREYFNKFYNLYVHVENRLVTIPALNRQMRLIIVSDITAQKLLENKIALQKALHDCIETLFTTENSEISQDEAFRNILQHLKTYYQADRAFFFKFKNATSEVENFYEVSNPDMKKVNPAVQNNVADEQRKLIKAVSKEKLIDVQSIIELTDQKQKEHLTHIYELYQIKTFSCVEVSNKDDDIIAFMGVINPKANSDSKELMELLSRFICMFIEHAQDEAIKEESLKLEALSEEYVVTQCARNFQNLTNPKENITSALEALCHHYDSDFSLILTKQQDGSCSATYVAGQNIPDLSPLQNQASNIMERWVKAFEKHPKFASDVDFVDLNESSVKRILHAKYGVYNFIVSPIQDSNAEISGLLFLNNFKLLNRSRLLASIVAKNISDYLEKISIYENSQLEPHTKLYNKIATQKQISKLLENGNGGTLFIIDIDDFKQLNDTLGHSTGDKAIVELAGDLKKIFRITDIIGRVGGDEFMVFSPGLISDDLIKQKANQILENCNREYENDNLVSKISASIGICTAKYNCDDFQTLYEKADYALYHAKKQGKNRYNIYSCIESAKNSSIEEEMQSHRTIVKELNLAIKNNSFCVHYQPIYHVPSGTFTQAEALVRIAKKDGTLIYPNEFIQIAENTNLIVDMTYKILEQICRDYQTLLITQPSTQLKSISINVSYLQFTQPDMEERFIEILDKYGIKPSQIKIEITERSIIADLDLMIKKMVSMQEKGFVLELDDFGTNYSNLQICIALPVNIIKLDRSVLLAAWTSDVGDSIFGHIVAAIHETGRQTVLEGVENSAQLDWAKKRKCEYIQGYYFSKPLNFENFSAFLLENNFEK